MLFYCWCCGKFPSACLCAMVLVEFCRQPAPPLDREMDAAAIPKNSLWKHRPRILIYVLYGSRCLIKCQWTLLLCEWASSLALFIRLIRSSSGGKFALYLTVCELCYVWRLVVVLPMYKNTLYFAPIPKKTHTHTVYKTFELHHSTRYPATDIHKMNLYIYINTQTNLNMCVHCNERK